MFNIVHQGAKLAEKKHCLTILKAAIIYTRQTSYFWTNYINVRLLLVGICLNIAPWQGLASGRVYSLCRSIYCSFCATTDISPICMCCSTEFLAETIAPRRKLLSSQGWAGRAFKLAGRRIKNHISFYGKGTEIKQLRFRFTGREREWNFPTGREVKGNFRL